jgi:protein-S-isoprenylcysteine O-methyltransferase Ste14
VSVLSPLFTFAILMFGSGITLAEERYNKRHGRDEWYLAYRRRTSPLLPCPPFLYQALPQAIKLLFFFEVLIPHTVTWPRLIGMCGHVWALLD